MNTKNGESTFKMLIHFIFRTEILKASQTTRCLSFHLSSGSFAGSVFKKSTFLSPCVLTRPCETTVVGSEKKPVHAKRMGFFVDWMDGKLGRKTPFFWCRKTFNRLNDQKVSTKLWQISPHPASSVLSWILAWSRFAKRITLVKWRGTLDPCRFWGLCSWSDVPFTDALGFCLQCSPWWIMLYAPVLARMIIFYSKRCDELWTH